MNLSTGKELFSQKQDAEVKGYRVKGHYTFGARVQPEAAGLAGGLSPSSTCHLSWVLRSGWQQWSEDSAPARPSRFWVGRRPRPGRGRTPVRPGGPSIGGGGYTSPASPPPPQWHHEARSRISPVPALTSRQRRRILSHAIWRARRSPAHCGGRGRGQRGRCPPWSQEETAGPPPPSGLGARGGAGGWGRGVAGALRLRVELLELEHPKGWRRRPLGSASRCLLPPPPAQRLPGAQDQEGLLPVLPPHRRRRPGSPHLSTQPGRPQESHVWLKPGGGHLGLTHLLPRPASVGEHPPCSHRPATCLLWGHQVTG